MPGEVLHGLWLGQITALKKPDGAVRGINTMVKLGFGPLWRFCEGFARANLLDEIVRVVKMVCVTAFHKPSGGVRGIVVGDIVTRLVARTISQQITPAVEVATAPFQFAISTRAGTECVAHVLQCMTDVDPLATIVSVDGVGAFDLVSQSSRLSGLLGLKEVVLLAANGAILCFS